MKKAIAFLVAMFVVTNINAQTQSAKTRQTATSITGVFTLISGNCSEDGCTYTFKNDRGKKVYASIIPETVVQFNDMEFGREIKKEFLNKKYSLKYSIKKVYHEESNSSSEEMIISEMTLIK